ncbi:MAG TPA: sulfatase-like hydrolase/transferase [Opitutus sp.]|nr:sulfatase-like hydrolase/transferase [Opitutus sp.]
MSVPLFGFGLPAGILWIWLGQATLTWLLTRRYARHFGSTALVRRMLWLHCAGVGFILGVVLLAWAVWPPLEVAQSYLWLDRVFPTVLAIGLLGLNLFHLLQILLVRIWFEPLKPALIPTFVPQLRSLAAAVGPAPYLAVGAVAGLGAVATGCVWLLSPAIQAWVRWPPAAAAWVRLHAFYGVIALAAAIGLILILRKRGVGTTWFLALYYDPILSFWLWRPEKRFPLNLDLAAEIHARESYPVAHANPPRRHVIVITVDCWRWDHLSVMGYERPTTPFLDTLKAAGRLHSVDHAVAVSNASRPGIMSVLASRYLGNIHPGIFRLHDVLKLHGYRNHFLLSGDHSAFENLRACYGPNVDVFMDGLSRGVPHTTNDDRNVVAALRQLPRVDGTPGFFYLHLMSPHDLGVLEDEAIRWPVPGARIGLRKRYEDPASAVDCCDNKTLQADLHLRRIFAALEQKGYLDQALIVLTADHGQGLGEHGSFGHRINIREPELRIPLFFVDEPAFAYGSLPFASQVDVAPTVLDRLGLSCPATWAGHSLLRRPRARAHFACASATPWSHEMPWSGFVEPAAGHCWKYLFRVDSAGQRHEQLFDLAADPGEFLDLTTQVDPRLLASFRQAAGFA